LTSVKGKVTQKASEIVQQQQSSSKHDSKVNTIAAGKVHVKYTHTAP